MNKIRPSLWFDHNVEEAIEFYTSVFKNAKVLGTSYYQNDVKALLAKSSPLTWKLKTRSSY